MRNHGTLHSSSFLYVVFRIVFFAVLCRFVLSNGSLFGESSSSSISTPSWIWTTRIVGGGEGDSDDVKNNTQVLPTRQQQRAQSERKPQHEDAEEDPMDNGAAYYETEAPSGSQTFMEFIDENGSSMSFREAESYSNDTYTLAMAGTSLWDHEHDAEMELEEEEEHDDIGDDVEIILDDNDTHTSSALASSPDSVTHQSDLTLPGRHVHIVTTAALPWMTGTAVNPLLRAAYLYRRLMAINNDQPPPIAGNNSTTSSSNEVSSSGSMASWVTLVVPWLELPVDQEEVYNGRVFESMEEQEAYIRGWLRTEAGMPDAADGLSIVFYPARYHSQLHSVFAMGDIIDQLPEQERHHLDVCILEEPEHLNWFRAPGDGWTKRYKFVLGIVHTNYKEYASTQLHGIISAPALSLMSTAMVRAYCHKVIKLSDVLQTFAPEKETTSNVHGVRGDFLSSSSLSTDSLNATAPQTIPNTTRKEDKAKSDRRSYFIGKLLWAKGLDLMLSMEDYYKHVTGEYFPIDIYGSGPDQKEISRAFLGIRKFSGDRNSDNSVRHSNGRQREAKKSSTADRDVRKFASRSSIQNTILTNVFAWANRRSIFQKRRRKIGANNNSQSLSMEEMYIELLRSVEALPVKAKESLDRLQSNAKETLQVVADYADEMLLIQPQKLLSPTTNPSSADSSNLLETIHDKAKATLEQLSEDLPKTFYELRRQPIPSTFPGRVDHSELKDSHSIFINPSVSEVLCTTTAEALAMGKFAIIPVHPSNTFFLKFPNCLAYRNKLEFVANLRWALTHDPEPLTPELAREFTWEAATDRLITAAAITHQEALERERLGRSRLDSRIAWIHNELGKYDVVRKVFGAGPVSDQVKYEELRTYPNAQSARKQRKRQRRRQGGHEQARVVGMDSSESDEESTSESEGEDDVEVSDTEGLLVSRKFRKSSFVRAIRAAAANGLGP